MTLPSKVDTLVIGGGLSGLSAAFSLHQKSLSTCLLEISERASGVIRSERKDGFLIEHGPHTLQIHSQKVADFIDTFIAKDSVLKPNPSAHKRHIIHKGKLLKLPSSAKEALVSPFLSARGKLRLLKEFLSPKNDKDCSVADFIRSHLGGEALDTLIQPLISGIYAGDPERLSMRYTFPSLFEAASKHGSILKSFFKNKPRFKRKIISFRHGMEELTQALIHPIASNIYYNALIKGLTYANNTWTVHLPGHSIKAKHLVITTPAYALPQLAPEDPSLKSAFQSLSSIKYAPIALVSLGFKDVQQTPIPESFGFLASKKSNCRLLGSLFCSKSFAHRAPDNHNLITSFIGGSLAPELLNKTDPELIDITRHELKRLTGLNSAPVVAKIKRYNKAIPQYELDYQRHENTINKIHNTHPQLHLLGNYHQGVSVSQAIEKGIDIADTINCSLALRQKVLEPAYS